MLEALDLVEVLINLILASFGGIVSKLVEQEKYPEKKLSGYIFFSSAVISLFVGIIFFAICKHFGWSPWITMATTAGSGFVGYPAAQSLLDVIITRVNLEAKKQGGV